MRARWVHVERDLSAPPAEVFEHLAEHENLAALFGAKVTRLADGDTERNGVGSCAGSRSGRCRRSRRPSRGSSPTS